MKIRDAKPGEIVTIAEGPAKGRRIRIVAKSVSQPGKVGVRGADDNGDWQAVRGDLEVKR
jgi:hypothetical protein